MFELGDFVNKDIMKIWNNEYYTWSVIKSLWSSHLDRAHVVDVLPNIWVLDGLQVTG